MDSKSSDHLFEQTDPPGGISAENPEMIKLGGSALYNVTLDPAKML